MGKITIVLDSENSCIIFDGEASNNDIIASGIFLILNTIKDAPQPEILREAVIRKLRDYDFETDEFETF